MTTRRLRLAAMSAVFGVACTQLLGVETGTAVLGDDAGPAAPSSEDGGACRANLRLDGRNCGRCGRDCLGASCIDGECVPIELGAVPAGTFAPRLFARGRTLVLATAASEARGAPTQLWRIEDTSPPRPLGAPIVGRFAVAPDAVYAWSCAPTGGAAVAGRVAPHACALLRRSLDEASSATPFGPRLAISPKATDAFGQPLEELAPALTWDEAAGKLLVTELPPPASPGDSEPGLYVLDGETLVSRTTVPVVEPVLSSSGFLGVVRGELENVLASFAGTSCDGGSCMTRLTSLDAARGGWLEASGRVFFWTPRTGSLRYGLVEFDGGARVSELGTIPVGSTGPPASVLLSEDALLYTDLDGVFRARPSASAPPERVVGARGDVLAMTQSSGTVVWVADGSVWKVAR